MVVIDSHAPKCGSRANVQLGLHNQWSLKVSYIAVLLNTHLSKRLPYIFN